MMAPVMAPVIEAPRVVVEAPRVVVEQPRVEVVIPPVRFEEPVVLDLAPPMMMQQGLLKLRLNRAHIRFHEGPAFERMSPFVKINCEGFEWKSVHKEHAGRDPEWGMMAVMEFDVVRPEAMMRIEIKDH